MGVFSNKEQKVTLLLVIVTLLLIVLAGLWRMVGPSVSHFFINNDAQQSSGQDSSKTDSETRNGSGHENGTENESDYSHIKTFEQCVEAGFEIPTLAPPRMCETPDRRVFYGSTSNESR